MKVKDAKSGGSLFKRRKRPEFFDEGEGLGFGEGGQLFFVGRKKLVAGGGANAVVFEIGVEIGLFFFGSLGVGVLP